MSKMGMLAILFICLAIYWAMNMQTAGAAIGMRSRSAIVGSGRNPFVGQYEGWDQVPSGDE